MFDAAPTRERPEPRNNKALHLTARLEVSGARRRNRTTDTRIFNPLLYRLSYPGKQEVRIKLVSGLTVNSLTKNFFIEPMFHRLLCIRA